MDTEEEMKSIARDRAIKEMLERATQGNEVVRLSTASKVEFTVEQIRKWFVFVATGGMAIMFYHFLGKNEAAATYATRNETASIVTAMNKINDVQADMRLTLEQMRAQFDRGLERDKKLADHEQRLRELERDAVRRESNRNQDRNTDKP